MTLSSYKTIKIDSSSLQDLLSGIDIFSGLSDDQVSLFIDSAKCINVPKGGVIYIEHDRADFFYIVKSGWVKIFRETLDGTEAVIDVITLNHIFAEDAAFGKDRYSNSAQAVEESQIILFPVSLLKEAIKNNTGFASAMLTHMAGSREKRDMEIEHISAQNAAQRIGCFILRLCPAGVDKDISIQLPYDKVLIASRLNMKPETFSRALNKLREQTKIRINGATVEIDNINILSDFSCSACSSAYPCEDLK